MKHFDLKRNALVEDRRIDDFVSNLKTLFREHQLVLQFEPRHGRPVIVPWEADLVDYLDDALLGPDAVPSFLPEPAGTKTADS